MACVTTWNPLDKDPSFTLSEENEAATKSGITWKSLRAISPKSSGKYYFELVLNMPSGQCLVGIALSTMLLSNYVGADASSWGFYDTGDKYHSGSGTDVDIGYVTGDIVQFAVDLDTGKVWFGTNNTWVDSGDPGAGTGESYQSDSIKDNDVYIAGSTKYSPNVIRIRACDTDQIYSPPSGFTPWVVVPLSTLSGIVKENGVGVARTVRAYIRSTGALYSSTSSEPDGSFSLLAPDTTTEMFIISLADSAGGDYNALIYDGVKGVVV